MGLVWFGFIWFLRQGLTISFRPSLNYCNFGPSLKTNLVSVLWERPDPRPQGPGKLTEEREKIRGMGARVMILQPLQEEKSFFIFLSVLVNQSQEIWLLDGFLFFCTQAPSGKIEGLTLKPASPSFHPSFRDPQIMAELLVPFPAVGDHVGLWL